MTTRSGACCGSCARVPAGGDLAASPDGAVIRTGHALKISEVAFANPDLGCDVIHNFSTDGFEALHPKGGWPSTLTPPVRREVKKVVRSKPTEHGLRFSSGVCLGGTVAWRVGN